MLLSLVWLLFDWLAVLVVLRLLWLVVSVWDDRSAILLIISIVHKDVVLFCINDCFDQVSGVVSFSLENGLDDIHDLWSKTWESEEDFVDEASSKDLKLRVHILDQVEGWLSELVELRGDQVVEDIDRGETWNLISLVHGDCALNCHIRILLGGAVVLKVRVQSVELLLDLGTNRELLLLWTSKDSSLVIEFTSNLVLVAVHKLGDHRPHHMELLTLCGWHWLSKILELGLGFLQLCLDFISDVWQIVLNVSKQYPCQLVCQYFTTKVTWWHCRVDLMLVEELLLFSLGFLDRETSHDIFLSSVFDTDKTKSELNLLVHNHAPSISSSVHDIDLGDDTNSSDSLWIKSLGHEKSLRGGHICIGWHDTQDDCSWVGHVSGCHSSGDVSDVLRLAWDWDQGDTWQIDQGQIWASVRVDIQHDWLVNDVVLISSDLISQSDDGLLNLGEISKFLSWHLLGELSPRLLALVLMVETQLEWTSRHYSITSGEEVQSNDGLEHGGLSS